jgi:hypothetical protein
MKIWIRKLQIRNCNLANRDDPEWEPWHAEAVDVQGGPEESSSSDEDEGDYGGLTPVTLPENCVCEQCRFDETKAPFRCCGQEVCLSLTEPVAKLLDRQVLEVQLAHRYAAREDHNQLLAKSFRFVAYRNLFFFIYGRTRAKMSRKPIPSCLMMKVRAIYPDPSNTYTGFKNKKRRLH